MNKLRECFLPLNGGISACTIFIKWSKIWPAQIDTILESLAQKPSTSFSETALSETWDGTSWTEVADLTTARRWASASTITGTDSAFIAGGLTATPAATNAVEEWTNPVYAIKTVTVS